VIALTHNPRHEFWHEFWPDSVSFADCALPGVIGHRQVTDGYLAELARVNQGRVATFDRGLASSRPDVAELIPTQASPA
jgi:predicted nucleic acid-binding protein